MSFVSSLSQLFHLADYSVKKPKMQLEVCFFIVSIDVDVGARALGLMNRGKYDRCVSSHSSEYSIGEIEERAVPLLVALFNDFEMPVTFAIRGQLTELDGFNLKPLLQSPIKHDIGAHGYYHRHFEDLSQNDAENELKMISAGMKRIGVIPRSFVFPSNRVAHLNLLEKYGYKCYREYGDLMRDGMYIVKKGQLYDIHPSLFLGSCANSMIIRKIVDIAIAKRLPFHLWFHPWNLGKTTDSIQTNMRKVLFPLFRYVQRKKETGKLTFETMLSAAEKVEKLGSTRSVE